ncbi:hypothetical protein NP233_g9086 [Leucocoprinus birnbaumii]|uniref:Protein kinase domain-containing protein n=1 Tax=Leucocoprinus birnbaumii TaxID=56174 RepID=A0AAD5VLT1_9AGAR|nr:hypothetical protein NP233_g9086 [Leucocoprinus birnbaumii]
MKKISIDEIIKTDKLIAVIGPAGSGKHRFVDVLSQGPGTPLNHQGHPFAGEIESFVVGHHQNGLNFRVILVVIPGFGNPNRNDVETLVMTNEWLEKTYRRNIRFTGVLYFHRISDNRMNGILLRNLWMFGEVCGDKIMPRVLFVTTMWNQVNETAGKRREKELKKGFWSPMVKYGARVTRFKGDYRSAKKVLNLIVADEYMTGIQERGTFLLQEETVDLEQRFYETHAARMLKVFLLDLSSEQKLSLKKLRAQTSERENTVTPLLLRALREEEIRLKQEYQRTLDDIRVLEVPAARRLRSQFRGTKKGKIKPISFSSSLPQDSAGAPILLSPPSSARVRNRSSTVPSPAQAFHHSSVSSQPTHERQPEEVLNNVALVCTYDSHSPHEGRSNDVPEQLVTSMTMMNAHPTALCQPREEQTGGASSDLALSDSFSDPRPSLPEPPAGRQHEIAPDDLGSPEVLPQSLLYSADEDLPGEISGNQDGETSGSIDTRSWCPLPTFDQRSIELLLKLLSTSARSLRDSVEVLEGHEAQSMANFLHHLLRQQDRLTSRDTRIVLSILCRLTQSSQKFPEQCKIIGVECDFVNCVDEGGFGWIYKGIYHDRVVCVKTARMAQKQADPRFLKVQARELILWTHLCHRNILPIYGVFLPPDAPQRICIVSPWMENGDLNQYLHTHPDADKTSLILDIIAGLEYLHSLRIVHADLKASNVLVSEKHQALLADFGISRVCNSVMSASEDLGGTVRWMAPELLTVDPSRPTMATDIWSFGCVCYEMFVQKHPYYRYEHPAQLIIAHTMAPTVPLQPEEECLFGHDIILLLGLCWERDPLKRPDCATIRALLSHLEAANEPEDSGRGSGEDVAFSKIWQARSNGETDYRLVEVYSRVQRILAVLELTEPSFAESVTSAGGPSEKKGFGSTLGAQSCCFRYARPRAVCPTDSRSANASSASPGISIEWQDDTAQVPVAIPASSGWRNSYCAMNGPLRTFESLDHSVMISVPSPVLDVRPLVVSGPARNRVDLVFFSDGYTTDEADKFFEDAKRLANDVSQNQTFYTVKPLINFWGAFTPSQESGIGVGGVPKDTVYGLYRDGTELRAVYYDKPEVAHAACDSMEEQCDFPILLGNDPLYGGHNASQVVPWDHWLSELPDGYDYDSEELDEDAEDPLNRVERSIMPMQVYPWTLLNTTQSWSIEFNASGTYSRHIVRFSLSGLPEADDLHIELDGIKLDWVPKEGLGLDRWHYDIHRDGGLSDGKHELAFTLLNKDREGVAQLCSAEILEFGNESEFISTPGFYSLYPTFSDKNETSYRPTNEDCLMRVVTTPNFCKVCTEGLWISLMKRIDLVDTLTDSCCYGTGDKDGWHKVLNLDLIPLAQLREQPEGVDGPFEPPNNEKYSINWFKDGEYLEEFTDQTSIALPDAEGIGHYRVTIRFTTDEVLVDEDDVMASEWEYEVTSFCQDQIPPSLLPFTQQDVIMDTLER